MRKLEDVLNDQVLMQEIETAVRHAGHNMTSVHVQEREIEKKEGRSNFVTRYDKMNQEYLRNRFSELLPEAAFVGEEDQTHGDSLPEGFVWIVDPIDGTTNFIQGFPNSTAGYSSRLKHTLPAKASGTGSSRSTSITAASPSPRTVT